MKNKNFGRFNFKFPLSSGGCPGRLFVLLFVLGLGKSFVAFAGPNFGRMQPATTTASPTANQGASHGVNQDNAAKEFAATEPASLQTMNQKLLQYNEMSRRVHDRRFKGAADEDQLKVATALPKPERGTIGSQMQAQDNQERNQEQTDETSGDQTHD